MTGTHAVSDLPVAGKYGLGIRLGRQALLLCLLVLMATVPELQAQSSDDQEDEGPLEAFDHKNWYTLEMVIFSRPLEDASVHANNDPNLEQLRVHQQIKLPALLKTLLPAASNADSPAHLGLLSSLLNSYKYRTIAKSTKPGAIPELDDLLLWLSEIKTSTYDNLAVLQHLETAGQYWPYIEPLFANRPTLRAGLVNSQVSTLLERLADDGAMSIEIPHDLAFRTSTNLRLIDEANKLDASKQYQVLWHKAWHQPLSSRGKGIPLLIQGRHSVIKGTDLPFASLDGIATATLGRFLHVHIQLWSKLPELPELRNQQQGFIEFDAKVRLRSKEYHYLDHPYLGVILLIVPLQPKPDRFSPDRYTF